MGRVETLSRRAVVRAADVAHEQLAQMQAVAAEQWAQHAVMLRAHQELERMLSRELVRVDVLKSRVDQFAETTSTRWGRLCWLWGGLS